MYTVVFHLFSKNVRADKLMWYKRNNNNNNLLALGIIGIHTRPPYYLPLNLKVLPEEQHGDRDIVLRRGRSRAFKGESDQPAATKHGGSGHTALHACLRALLRHRAHRVHQRSF